LPRSFAAQLTHKRRKRHWENAMGIMGIIWMIVVGFVVGLLARFSTRAPLAWASG